MKFLSSLGCLLMAFGVWADEWPTYQHDTFRSAVSSEVIQFPLLEPIWTYQSPIPPQPAWAGPAKWDAYAGIRGLKSMREFDPVFHVISVSNHVFFASTVDDSVRGLKGGNGEEIWRFTAEGPVRGTPSYDGERVYFGSDDGWVYCVEAWSGRLIWKFRPSEIPEHEKVWNDGRLISFWPCRTGVLVRDGIAYFALGMLPWKESYLCAVDAITGKAEGEGRFIKRLEKVTMEGAFAASRDRLIAPQGRVPPLMFRLQDGAELGALKGGGGCFLLVTPEAQVVFGPGNKTGWLQTAQQEAPTKIATMNGGKAMMVKGELGFLLTDTEIRAFDRATQTVRWSASDSMGYSFILAGDHLVSGHQDRVIARNALTGEKVWKGEVHGKVYGLAVANGRLFASTDEGEIVGFEENPKSPGWMPPKPPLGQLVENVQEPEWKDLADFSHPALKQRWVFHPQQVQGNHLKQSLDSRQAVILGDLDWTLEGRFSGLKFDGQKQGVVADYSTKDLPAKEITAEAWVRVDQPLEWGGIVGAIQDNGSFERGWLLGYSGKKFAFAVCGTEGPGNLTYLKSAQNFIPGRWYHVVGTYDGIEMRLYVNGKLDQTSSLQKGAISYPDSFFYEIGAYHDQDEHYRLTGAIQEVRVYHQVLTEEEVASHAGELSDQGEELSGPLVATLRSSPILTFVAPDRAEVRWTTDIPLPTFLEWGIEGEPWQEINHSQPVKDHRVELKGLRHKRLYYYRIGVEAEGERKMTDRFECDNYFNFSQATPPLPSLDWAFDSKELQVMKGRLDHIPSHRGIALWMGSGWSRGQIMEWIRHTQFRILIFTPSLEEVAELRKAMLEAEVYGHRVVVSQWNPLQPLPVPAWSANLVRVKQDPRNRKSLDPRMAMSLVRPMGGSVWIEGVEEGLGTSDLLSQWGDMAREMGFAEPKEQDPVGFFVRDMSSELGQWSHQYGSGHNAAYDGESLSGATDTDDFEVLWLGRPGPRAQPDRNGRKPSPLSVGGRLFVQGLQRLIALDAYNGTILWSAEIPGIGRFNIPRDTGNWCATTESVLIAVGEECWEFDAIRGDLVNRRRVLPGKGEGEEWDWGYLFSEAGRIYGSSVRKGTQFTEYWGGADAGWYDAKSGDVVEKVGTRTVFAMDHKTGETLWQYEGGFIPHSTMTVSQGVIYFVENRNPEIISLKKDRMESPDLWSDLSLVALDAATGQTLWQRPIQPEPGKILFQMAMGEKEKMLVLVSSGDGQYRVQGIGGEDGGLRWERSVKWPQDHHGGHMARPAIVEDRVIVRPGVMDLLTGELLEIQLPGGGCGTYAASRDALFFRSGTVTVWEQATGKSTNWDRLRPDCWLSTIPAAGLLLSPEGGGGCSCGTWMETSIAFKPKLAR